MEDRDFALQSYLDVLLRRLSPGHGFWRRHLGYGFGGDAVPTSGVGDFGGSEEATELRKDVSDSGSCFLVR